jgi:hypothetical protein
MTYFDVGHQCSTLAVSIFIELLDGRRPDGGSELVEISNLLVSVPVLSQAIGCTIRILRRCL